MNPERAWTLGGLLAAQGLSLLMKVKDVSSDGLGIRHGSGHEDACKVMRLVVHETSDVGGFKDVSM